MISLTYKGADGVRPYDSTYERIAGHLRDNLEYMERRKADLQAEIKRLDTEMPLTITAIKSWQADADGELARYEAERERGGKR